ncbi:MAG: hypothetical protein HRT45_11025 [Bdellovibrionales bacterium]|nr:hypothetical protein [Bdellovibrionales bacterium]
MIIVKLITTVLFSLNGYAVEYADSEYVIPEHETPGIINTGCEENYIPVHSRELLRRVQDWAVGDAFFTQANYAGFDFDHDQYLVDNPHQGLFNFGMATVTTCLEVDVITPALSMQHSLKVLKNNVESEGAAGQERFAEVFYQTAVELGFDIYLTPIEESEPAPSGEITLYRHLASAE